MKIWSWFLIGLGTIAASCTSNAVPAQGTLNVPELKRGGNLTGWFQFGEFQESRFNELQRISELGVDFIRLPIEPTRFYDRSSTNWNLLERTLTEARRLGTKVIVDLHPAFNTQRLALTGDERYTKLLEDMARYLTKFGADNVLLELMNEPVSPTDDKCDKNFDWNAWQRKFYDAARVGSRDITIVLTGACWGGIDGLLEVTPIQDQRVIYSIHNYELLDFTHQGASWTGPGQWYLKGLPYPATPERVQQALPRILYDVPTSALKAQYRYKLQAYGSSGFGRAAMERSMIRARDWATRNNARLLLGEYGVYLPYSLPQDRVQWMRDMRETAESMGMAHAIWDLSPSGTFGPYRDGKPEVGALEALGFKVPSDAIPTPANPTLDSGIPVNPVGGSSLPIADFAAGSQNLAGRNTQYFAYGKPDQPTYTAPGANGTAPTANGRLEFDYNLPLNNDYGGVTAVIPVKDGSSIDATAYTHVRLELTDKVRSKVRVSLSSSKVDSGGDHPETNVQVETAMTTFTIPLRSFRQAGWGKPVNLNDVLKNLENVEVTALEEGKVGRLIIDNIALVSIVDAGVAPALPTDKQNLLYNFELPNNAGNGGGTWSYFGYQQNPNSKVITSASTSSLGGSQVAQLDFDIPVPNEWGVAAIGLPLASTQSALEYAALRFDASITARTVVRVELNTTFDVGNDHPQFYLMLTPDIKTYRIPIGEFAQAGWGKPIDLNEALKNTRAITINVDTVGAKGTLKVDNVTLEKR